MTRHLARVYLRDDSLRRTTIVDAFEVYKEKPTSKLHIHWRGYELGWWLFGNFLVRIIFGEVLIK